MRTIPVLPRVLRRVPSAVPFGAWVFLTATLAAASSTLLAEPGPSPADAAHAASSSAPSARLQIAQAWIRELFGTGIAPGLPDRPPSRERFPDTDDRPEPRERPERFPAPSSGTYRTVCVRLCDGFYFPISFSTSRSHFAQDAQRCEQSCPGRSRLFVHPTGASDEPAHMTDLEGKPYADLPNAYRSQKQYVAGCTCRGNPWDPQEIARHESYADAAKPVAGSGKSKAASTPSPSRARGRAIAGREPSEKD